jgi:deoxyribonuclease-4
MLLGAHESIGGKLSKAIDLAVNDGCDCLQIFTKSPRMWNSPKISKESAEDFKKKAKEFGIHPIVSHASYLINLANDDAKKRKAAILNLVDELIRAEQLELMGVMFHPGSNASKEKGIKFVIEGINEALDKTKGMKSLLMVENMSGQGNWVGNSFEELKAIFDGVIDKKRFGFCIDTCHLFAYGYNIRDDYNKIFKEFDRIVGLKNIKCFHLNDSLMECASKKDRHEHMGKGKIGGKFFKQLINDKRFKDILGCLETPDGEYKKDIEYLRSLQKTS